MTELRAEKSIEINAPAEKVWGLMTQISRWAEWIPVIHSAEPVKGEALEPGSRFKFKPELGMLSINLAVTVIESDPPLHVTWKGGGPGVSAVHAFDLDEKEGITRLTSSETFSGLAVPLLRLAFGQKDLDNLHQRWIEGLKQAAEK